MSKKRNSNKKKPTQFTPNTKRSRIQQAKGFYKQSINEPTIDTFPEVLSSDELDYELPEDSFDYERPSEKGFSFEGFYKPILISITVAVILGIGSWILSHHLKIALLEQVNLNQGNTIKFNVQDIKSVKTEIENIKSEQKLEQYRIEQLEERNEKTSQNTLYSKNE